MEKKRKPWLAAVLSGFEPGLGQLYNGNLKLALIYGALSILVYCAGLFWLVGTMGGLLFSLGAGLVLFLFSVIQAFREAKRINVMALKPMQKIRYYALFFLVVTFSPAIATPFTPTESRFQTFSIPSASMEPTLLIGDYVMADTWVFARREPERGEVIVFDYPKDHDTKYVKRLIGLPGDTIQLKLGTLFVNGKEIEDTPNGSTMEDDGYRYDVFTEHFFGHDFTVHKLANGRLPLATFGPITVPPGKYFAMGDNRDRSSDSRVWGYVSKEELIGKMLYLYFSIDKETYVTRISRLGMHVL